MPRVAARTLIALMQNFHTLRDLALVRDPAQMMREDALALNVHLAVAARLNVPAPNPALCRSDGIAVEFDPTGRELMPLHRTKISIGSMRVQVLRKFFREKFFVKNFEFSKWRRCHPHFARGLPRGGRLRANCNMRMRGTRPSSGGAPYPLRRAVPERPSRSTQGSGGE